jgi:hypothetical protein
MERSSGSSAGGSASGASSRVVRDDMRLTVTVLAV